MKYGRVLGTRKQGRMDMEEPLNKINELNAQDSKKLKEEVSTLNLKPSRAQKDRNRESSLSVTA